MLFHYRYLHQKLQIRGIRTYRLSDSSTETMTPRSLLISTHLYFIDFAKKKFASSVEKLELKNFSSQRDNRQNTKSCCCFLQSRTAKEAPSKGTFGVGAGGRQRGARGGVVGGGDRRGWVGREDRERVNVEIQRKRRGGEEEEER